MLSRLLKRLLGSRHQRVVKTYQQIVETINRLEESYQKLTDDALKRKPKNSGSVYEIARVAMIYCLKPMQWSRIPAAVCLAAKST